MRNAVRTHHYRCGQAFYMINNLSPQFTWSRLCPKDVRKTKTRVYYMSFSSLQEDLRWHQWLRLSSLINLASTNLNCTLVRPSAYDPVGSEDWLSKILKSSSKLVETLKVLHTLFIWNMDYSCTSSDTRFCLVLISNLKNILRKEGLIWDTFTPNFSTLGFGRSNEILSC
jgi:hypothetical protein